MLCWLPTDMHILLPRACEYITLHGQRDFADTINLRVLRWRDYLSNHKCPYKRKVRSSEKAEKEMSWEKRSWSDAKKGLWAEECKWLLEADKGEKMDTSLEPPERIQPWQLQNFKIIILCCVICIVLSLQICHNLLQFNHRNRILELGSALLLQQIPKNAEVTLELGSEQSWKNSS